MSTRAILRWRLKLKNFIRESKIKHQRAKSRAQVKPSHREWTLTLEVIRCIQPGLITHLMATRIPRWSRRSFRSLLKSRRTSRLATRDITRCLPAKIEAVSVGVEAVRSQTRVTRAPLKCKLCKATLCHRMAPALTKSSWMHPSMWW